MWLVRILKQAMPTAYIATQTDIRAPSPVRCPNAHDPEGSQLTTCAMSSCGVRASLWDAGHWAFLHMTGALGPKHWSSEAGRSQGPQPPGWWGGTQTQPKSVSCVLRRTPAAL